jgi:hypothetical protein
VERARYAAERAERAHAACEPENRLVARSLETRWEARLVELAEAEAALAAASATQPPLPPADELAAAVADLPALWSAPTTSDRDRKRVLRTLLGDITLRPGPTPQQLRVGLRWNSGATEELLVARMRPVTQWRRAAPEAVALARELGPRLANPELAAALNAAGHRTGTGKPFDRTAAGNLRHAYRIGSPDLLADGELTPRAVADRLGVAVGVVHGWLTSGELTGRRSPAGRWCIPFPPDVEATCRARVATSSHLHRDSDGVERQPGEASIAEIAVRLRVNTDVVYYWAERGYLPTRRGQGGRRWVALTPELEAACGGFDFFGQLVGLGYAGADATSLMGGPRRRCLQDVPAGTSPRTSASGRMVAGCGSVRCDSIARRVSRSRQRSASACSRCSRSVCGKPLKHIVVRHTGTSG